MSSVAKWQEFFATRYKEEIGTLVTGGGKSESKQLFIEHSAVVAFDTRLADQLLSDPDIVKAHAEEALSGVDLPVKKQIDLDLRFVNLPVTSRVRVRDIRNDHTDKLVAIVGTVRKASEVKQVILEGAFECARCKNITIIPMPGDGTYLQPSYCSCNEEKRGVFRLIRKQSKFNDWQRIKLQENMDDLKGGEQPEDISCNIYGNLVNEVDPGEHVIFNGILRQVQHMSRGDATAIFDKYFDVISIEKEQEEIDVDISPEDIALFHEMARRPTIYREIFDSVCPTVYGHDIEKEAIAYVLAGGVSKTVNGSRLRGIIHVLLVGDPGVAKSQMIRYAIGKLTFRGVYTSGKTASSAGLTAAAVKDDIDGSWTLEAGALVVANKSTAGIDEMDKMKPEDRTSLHEVMEQGTISVAKAGILATLRAECAIIGAANPKLGAYDETLGIAEQINMPPSLMSRFDLIFIIIDKPDKDEDGNIADHILKTQYLGELLEAHKIETADVNAELDTDEFKSVKPPIDPDVLRKYIMYSKRFIPQMTPEIRKQVKDFYVKIRSANSTVDGSKAPVPVTARQLEGIVRLLEARVRLRLKTDITVEDVEAVKAVIMTSLMQCGYDKETGRFDAGMRESGIPKSQADRIKTLKELIGKLMIEEGRRDESDSVDIARIVDVAVEKYGMKEDGVHKEIAKLRTIGEAYEPKNGSNRIALTEKPAIKKESK